MNGTNPFQSNYLRTSGNYGPSVLGSNPDSRRSPTGAHAVPRGVCCARIGSYHSASGALLAARTIASTNDLIGNHKHTGGKCSPPGMLRSGEQRKRRRPGFLRPLLGEHYVMAAGYVDKILKGQKPPTCPSSSQRDSSSLSICRQQGHSV